MASNQSAFGGEKLHHTITIMIYISQLALVITLTKVVKKLACLLEEAVSKVLWALRVQTVLVLLFFAPCKILDFIHIVQSIKKPWKDIYCKIREIQI